MIAGEIESIYNQPAAYDRLFGIKKRRERRAGGGSQPEPGPPPKTGNPAVANVQTGIKRVGGVIRNVPGFGNVGAMLEGKPNLKPVEAPAIAPTAEEKKKNEAPDPQLPWWQTLPTYAYALGGFLVLAAGIGAVAAFRN